MLRIVIRRIAISILLLLVVSVVTFVVQSLLPGDPARSLLGVSATPEQYAALRKALHLNEPILAQYWLYLSGVFHGSLGTSIFTGDPVIQTLAQRIPVSLSLIVSGTVLATVLGVGLGVLSATGGSVLRRLVDIGSLVGSALPNFWVALVLASIFAVSLGLFPATGYTPLTEDPGAWAWGLVLPVIALALGAVSLIAKVVRDGMLTALEMDFVRTLRAAGIPERSIVWRHALRNSSVSLLTVIGVVLVGALSGTVLVENVFDLPGLGSLAVTATNNHDIPVLQGVALTFTVIVIIVNLAVDVLYGVLNPKVRVS